MTPIRETIARAILYESAPHKDAWELTGPVGRQNCLDQADAVLRALDAAGLAIVPREPTAFQSVEGQQVALRDGGDLKDCYRAMVAAANQGERNERD